MSGAVLVINATYEPISRTSLARAVALVLRGDAEIEESDPLRLIRSKDQSLLWPKIIRLVRFVKVPFRFGPQTWTKSGVLRRDKNACAYCTKHATTVDHVLPKAQGGKDTWDNTVACCLRCNAKKRDRTPKQASMTLLITPFTPMKARLNL